MAYFGVPGRGVPGGASGGPLEGSGGGLGDPRDPPGGSPGSQRGGLEGLSLGEWG
jgi:hypothetical protein